MKIVKILILLSAVLIDNSESAFIDCQYSIVNYEVLKEVYTCQVLNSFEIDSYDKAIIESVKGNHTDQRKNEDVESFDLFEKGVVKYFPRELNKFFKNLKVIRIYNSNLLEIHPSDLKPFPNLIELRLRSNQIEILEQGLFDFNPNLKYIVLRFNKISYIDSRVFDNLKHLSYLYLKGNECINSDEIDNVEKVKSLIKDSQEKCLTKNKYSEFLEQIQNLKNESNTLDANSFRQKLNKLEKDIKNSNYFYFFNDKLKNLKNKHIKMLNNELKFCSAVKENLVNFGAKYYNSMNQTQSCKSEEGTLLSLVDDKLTNVKQIVDNISQSSNVKFAGLSSKISSVSESVSLVRNAVSTVNETNIKFDQKLKKIDEVLTNLNSFMTKKITEIETKMNDDANMTSLAIRDTRENLDQKLKKIDEVLTNLNSFATKKIKEIETQMKDDAYGFSLAIRDTRENLNQKLKKIDEVLTNLNSFTTKKIKEIETQMKDDAYGTSLAIRDARENLENKIDAKFEDLDLKISVIMRVLSIDDNLVRNLNKV